MDRYLMIKKEKYESLVINNEADSIDQVGKS